MKMLTTQITGLLQRITANEEEAIEETARLLAQATVGQGRVIIAGFEEMDVIASNALAGAEVMHNVVRYEEGMALTVADRVWLLSRSAHQVDALRLAKQLENAFIPFAALAAEKVDDNNPLAELAYTYISTGLLKGILPNDNGERIVQPHAIAALFVYEAVKMEYDEILRDYAE